MSKPVFFSEKKKKKKKKENTIGLSSAALAQTVSGKGEYSKHVRETFIAWAIFSARL